MDLDTVEAVVPAELGAWRAGDAWLAGGTWLFSQPQPTISRLVDLASFSWPALTEREDGLEIAATCTLGQLSRWRAPAAWPAGALAAQCCRALLGSFKVWHTATVGGNICLSLPAGPMTALAVAVDGICTVWEPDGGVREVAALDFVTGPGRNVLAPGELLRSVLLPARALRARSAFRQLSLSPRGRSAVLVIARSDPGGLTVTITASVPRPAQLRFPGPPSAAELWAALDAAGLTYHADCHGDRAWRAHLTALYAEEVRRELAPTPC